VEEFEVDDAQRDAAVAHLESEHARGAFDSAELERRIREVRAARTVAQLLNATSDPTIGQLSEPSEARHTNRVALLAGSLVAIVLFFVLLSKLA